MPLESPRTFRRCGLRDDRRRRLLADDPNATGYGSDDWPASSGPRRSEHYGDAEFLDQQMRVLDFIPRRPFLPTIALLAVVAVAAGLEGAYAWMMQRVAGGGAIVAALDLDAKGSLACWFSSLLLLGASAAAILVYSVRRYRLDDYPGRYRVWRWAALGALLMATDQAASLREGFRDLMIGLAGTPLLGDGAIWWVSLYYALFLAIGSRLLADMGACRLSAGLLIGAAVAYSLALTAHLGWTPAESVAGGIMFRAGAEMLGQALTLFAMIFYARHVVLDAEGLLRGSGRPHETELEEEEYDEDRATEAASSGGTTWRELDPPHSSAPQPAYQRAAMPSPPPAFSSVSAAESSVQRKLTKQERKALKERLLRERRERERRGL